VPSNLRLTRNRDFSGDTSVTSPPSAFRGDAGCRAQYGRVASASRD
jgi:hypothetical protein